MKTVKIHLMDLVRRHDAQGAVWAYITDPDHVTPNVKCWQVTLLNPLMGVNVWNQPRRVAAHTFNLANGAELITDEYVAWQVLKRLEDAG
jgi:hypothetical protein